MQKARGGRSESIDSKKIAFAVLAIVALLAAAYYDDPQGFMSVISKIDKMLGGGF